MPAWARHDDCFAENIVGIPRFGVGGVFEMEWSIQVSEQHLLQASIDLRNQLAEVQKLREAIQSAEASKQRLPDPKVIDAPAGRELHS